MERMNMNSNTKKIRRAVSGIMAGVLVVSTIGYVTLSNSKEVKAKETLDSIEKVVNSITDKKHYTILEVVPDNVSYSVPVKDVRAVEHTVSGDQIMGFTGYYIGGQEPVRKDVDNIFNDTLEEYEGLEGTIYNYTASQLVDSHMRYKFADDMFAKLHEGNILNTGDAREIMTAPVYQTAGDVRYDAYYEIRDGELPAEEIQRQVESGKLTELYKDYDGRERLRDDKYKDEDPAPYIDEVKGVMLPSVSGNYLISYDMSGVSENAVDIAADMMGSYLDDNSVTEKHSLVYTSAFTDGAYDNDKFASRERGFFDPRLEHVDAEATVSANTVAVLARNEGARRGYVVVGNTRADNEHIPAIGTPLYKHVEEGNLSYFVYAGKYGSIEGFTLSGNQARRDEGRMTASTETHLNAIALSAGPGLYAEDELLDEGVDLDVGDNEVNVGADGDDDEANLPDDGGQEPGGDGDGGDGVDLDEPGETTDPADPADPADPNEPTDPTEPTEPVVTGSDYFMLDFEYKEDYSSFEVYYTVLDFYSSDQGDAQFYISPDKPQLVNSSMGRGSIGLIDNPAQSDLDYFVFDYVKNHGTHLWQHTQYYDVNAYDTALIYRIRGAKIYYGFNLTNNEWFKQYALDREPQECADLPIDVETKCISELTEEDITAYSMVVVLSGDNTLCVGDEYDDYAKNTNDFDTDVFARLVDRVSVEEIPVIGDYGIIRKGNLVVPGSWVYDFIRVLMLKPSDSSQSQSGFSIYNEAIKMLDLHTNHFDVADTTGASLYTDNDDHFVNHNAYVFNMKAGQDYLGLLNRYFYSMASLNRTAIEGFDADAVANGFKEVIDDINSENNYRMVDVAEGEDPKLLDTYVTEATAIRYIIGYANKREKNIKGTLRLLEIEPTSSFDLYIKDNLYPEQRTDCNSYGMAGKSYTTTNGNGNNNNRIMYRNGTYKEVTDNSKNLKSEGIVYRRSDDTWKDSGVTRDQAHSFIKIEGIDIELTRMSVAEFVGHVEDLNADYDVIYFGMNIQLLNTANSNVSDKDKIQKIDNKDVTTVYNDTDMRGLVYTNIGDKKKLQPILISDDTKMYSENEAKQDANAERYSGNDIDNECVKRLTQFVDAGYPIILADQFYQDASAKKENRKVNTDRVDSCSYMHQFVNNIITRNTVYSVTDVTKDKSDKDGFFVWLLNLAKPEIVIKEDTPAAESMKELSPDSQELSADNFKMYGYELTPDNFDGMFHLPFEFSIRNIGAASSNSRYTTELFVDLNADGKYSPREKMDFSAVRENGFTVNEDGTGMRTGYDYYAECKLANSYDGVIPWRLIVYQEGHPERRSDATGYFTLRKAEPLHIKILQLDTRKDRKDRLTGQTSRASSWNMEKTAYKGGKYQQKANEDEDKQVRYVDRLKTGHDFGDLLEKISPYYELEIKTIEADEWEKAVANGISNGHGGHPAVGEVTVNQYYEDLRHYDMVIVGFADCYMGPVTDNANEALEKFISSERSVLFTHDTTSFINYNYDKNGKIAGEGPWVYWGYYFNKHVRNISGMDRYAIMAGASPDDFHPYSIAYEPKSGTRTGPAGESVMSTNARVLYNTRGITNSQMSNRSYSTGTNNYTNLRGINTGNGQDGGGAGENDACRGNTVTQVNDGQITKFPFALHKSFTVTPTHYQYYQLDLTDDEDKDGEKDICVWYCISDAPNRSFSNGDLYEMSPNDVLNNYYIYNKGNVVYTGVGHRSVCDANGDAYMKSRHEYRNGNYNLGEKPNNGMQDNTDEMKLFINTMVAAYQRGIREPSLKVVRSFTDSSATGSVYVSYDQSIPGMTGGSESAVLDDDVSVFFTAARSNFVTSDERLKNDLRIKLYYEATEEEYLAGEAEQLEQFSREYDIPTWDPENPVELDEAEKHYYRNEDETETGLYGIPISIASAEYYAGGSKITRGYKLDDPSIGALPLDGLNVDYGEYLADDRIYKLTIGGVKSIKSHRSDNSTGDDLWYEYETGVSSNSIRGKSLNNRRIMLVLTNDTYNGDTDVGREESTMQYVTLTRAKMFTLY